MLTAQEALAKMRMNNTAREVDLLYQWIRQGVIRLKVFREIMDKMMESDEEQEEQFISEKYRAYVEEKNQTNLHLLENIETLIKKNGKKKAS